MTLASKWMRSRSLAIAAALLTLSGIAFGHGTGDGNFEGRQTHSIGLTPDGIRLLALNALDGRLCVFNVGEESNPQPVLELEIPVGIEPVSVRARTNDEVWVVNEVSDSISIVSLSQRTVIETLQTPDEPGDVVFAQGKAFVSCSRNGLVRVFNAVTRQPLSVIPLQGNYPHALATDGTKVFAAFLLSGNRTTILPASQAPPQPAPTNPNLPAPPQVALIVPTNDPRINFTVLDRDVVEIDAVTETVTRYFSDVGTNLFDLAVQPGAGHVWVANSEALNLTRFESALRGHVADHRVTRLDAVTGAPSVFDLNPGIDYSYLPNNDALAIALAQPTAIVFTADGTSAWVAGFNSDRVARVNAATGEVAERFDLRGNSSTDPPMRGPRSLALLESRQRLFSLNKISNTISVISALGGSILAEVPIGSNDPTFLITRKGRGLFFDARLSGNGTLSCATCHIDADLDGIAWDLGVPGGEMQTVIGANLSVHDPTPRPREMHPMKGPMMTQTLRALLNGAPFHWRGDRAGIPDFGPTFDKLMGGSAPSVNQMFFMQDYLLRLLAHPNPNRRLDNTLPNLFDGGNPVRGETLFDNHLNHCAECHSEHAGGLNNIDLFTEIGGTQPIKNPSLRTVYQRLLHKRTPGGTTVSGFGLLHDGTGTVLPTVHPYALDTLETAADFADVRAFILCFDTETPPALGMTRTVTSATAQSSAILADIALLEQQATIFSCDLVVQGVVNGRRRAFLFSSDTGLYRPDTTSEPSLTRAALLALLSGDATLTFLGVPSSAGVRLGGDRDTDIVLDSDEPIPKLTATRSGPNVHLEWPSLPAGWVLESTPDLGTSWSVVTRASWTSGAATHLEDPIGNAPSRSYRLRRTW